MIKDILIGIYSYTTGYLWIEMWKNTFGKKFNFDAIYDFHRQIIFQKTSLSYETDFVKPEFSLNLVKSEK